jgi:hypothetical protein
MNNQYYNNQNNQFNYQGYGTNPTPHPNPPTGDAVRAMVFGIIALSFSTTPIFSIIGIIFGALARKWATPIIINYPYTGARLFAKAGKITGSIGLGLGIGFTVFWLLYFVVIYAAMIFAMAA